MTTVVRSFPSTRLARYAKRSSLKVHAKYSVAAIAQDANDVGAQIFGVHTRHQNLLDDRERYERLPKKTATAMRTRPHPLLNLLQEASFTGISSVEISWARA